MTKDAQLRLCDSVRDQLPDQARFLLVLLEPMAGTHEYLLSSMGNVSQQDIPMLGDRLAKGREPGQCVRYELYGTNRGTS